MEIFRRASNPWGQEVLQGMSWDLVWVFIGAGVFAILVHMAWMWLVAPGLKRRDDEDTGAGS